MEHHAEPATLMYDGCMIYGDYYDNIELLEITTIGVEEQFSGLKIQWRYKCTSQILFTLL